jgi:hypothetical protein
MELAEDPCRLGFSIIGVELCSTKGELVMKPKNCAGIKIYILFIYLLL